MESDNLGFRRTWGAIVICLRIVLGTLFAWAALTKLPDMGHFSEEVARYQLLPAAATTPFAWLVMGAELAGGLLLMFNATVRMAARGIAVLLIVFIIALSQALLRGLDLSCGCFGGPEPVSWSTVVRDLFMLAGCIALAGWTPAIQDERNSTGNV